MHFFRQQQAQMHAWPTAVLLGILSQQGSSMPNQAGSLKCKYLLPMHFTCTMGQHCLMEATKQPFSYLQIVAHLVKGYNAADSANEVDGDAVPVPHFGAALTVQQFQDLAKRLTEQGMKFIIEPHLRFKGAPGEQVRVKETYNAPTYATMQWMITEVTRPHSVHTGHWWHTFQVKCDRCLRT
jgi:extradiol dioxygenase family protein